MLTVYAIGLRIYYEKIFGEINIGIENPIYSYDDYLAEIYADQEFNKGDDDFPVINDNVQSLIDTSGRIYYYTDCLVLDQGMIISNDFEKRILSWEEIDRILN